MVRDMPKVTLCAAQPTGMQKLSLQLGKRVTCSLGHSFKHLPSFSRGQAWCWCRAFGER